MPQFVQVILTFILTGHNKKCLTVAFPICTVKCMSDANEVNSQSGLGGAVMRYHPHLVKADADNSACCKQKRANSVFL